LAIKPDPMMTAFKRFTVMIPLLFSEI
jgi:hypothetical protein